LALIFLHIPRTGGTTLTRIARRHFRPDQIYMIDSTEPARSAAALSSLPQFVHDRLSLIAGHASFGVHRQVGGGQYFTLIRDPVDRVFSHYRYAQQRFEHPMHELAQRMSLSEMVEGDLWRDLSNGQCRALADNWNFPIQEQPQAVLDRARDNLADRFVLWGLTERFAETLLMARVALGWRDLSYAPENATRRRSGPGRDGTDCEAVVRCNALDIALYEELETRFQRNLDEVVPDWAKQLVRLELESRLGEPRRRLRRSYERARLQKQQPEWLEPTAGQGNGVEAGPGHAGSGEAAHTAAWLRRWVVGGYDWQTGQKEWMRRRIVGDHSWGRIASSFAFTEAMLEPCANLRRRSAYDVGSGPGHVSFALAGYFENVLAVDCALRPVVRAGVLRRASGLRRVRFVRADAGRFDPRERFDLILCNLMSHNGGGRMQLLHRLATLTDNEGWIIYAEETQGYAPMEIEAAIADRNVLMLRTRLRQLVAGIRGERAFRFFVAPTARLALEALGFEVIKEEMSWWRSLPASHRIWCRKTESSSASAMREDVDYVEPRKDLLELREHAGRISSAGGHPRRDYGDGIHADTCSMPGENPLAPLLILVEMAQYALPPLPEGSDARLPLYAVRAVDSRTRRAVDWCRIEAAFARFVDAVDRSVLISSVA
jgi:SAM-dependent methyltransferase